MKSILIGRLVVNPFQNIDLPCNNNEYTIMNMMYTRKRACRWPVGADRPVRRPNTAAVWHGKEVGNEETSVVGLLRAYANASSHSLEDI